MENAVLLELETSAKILLAPPNVVSNYQRHVAEAVFTNFKKTKSPFALCRYIFDNSKVEYVLFQTAALLKQSLISDWRLITRNDVASLRNYLLHYVLEKNCLPSYVMDQIFQVIAIIVKRSSVDGITDDKEFILTEVSRLISTGYPKNQMIGCSILSTVLNEYGNTVKSSDVGLTWEVHYKSKKAFERSDLKRIFQFCLQALYELEKSSVLTIELLTLLVRFLMIAEQILTWNFIYNNLPKRLISTFEDRSPSFRPGSSWKDLLMDKDVLNLFFKIHCKIRTQPEIICHSINCLTQLATLNGVIFSHNDNRVQYLTNFLQEFLNIMKSCTSDQEALGIATIISKLVIFFPLALVSKDLLSEFLNELTKITCIFIQQAAEKESIKDDHYYAEAVDCVLEAWESLFHDVQLCPEIFCKQAASEIIQVYLQSHLSPPEGSRNQSSVETDIDEVEEDDRTKYKEQLSVIGMFGRRSLSTTMPLLIRLMESRIHLLEQQLQTLHQNRSSDMCYMYNLYEDIHWLVLILL